MRELRNVLTRAVALAPLRSDRVAFDDLVINLASDATSPTTLGYCFPGVDTHLPYKEAKQRLISQFDDEYVQALLRRHGGNITQAARAADIDRVYLLRLLDKFGMRATKRT